MTFVKGGEELGGERDRRLLRVSRKDGMEKLESIC